jgi:hypothetical protein
MSLDQKDYRLAREALLEKTYDIIYLPNLRSSSSRSAEPDCEAMKLVSSSTERNN